MNKFQKLKFHSVNDFLAHLPPGELDIVESLRDLILRTLPDATEKLAYNVPFYYLNKRVCYIWPASVPWGGLTEGVSLGFCQAMLYVELSDKLHFGEKKEIGTLLIKSHQDVDKALILRLLEKGKQVDRELSEQ
ncbi:MAG: DUF1801 domain-containing protein [Fulvivirga sp.]